ncbi:MAG TPA: glutaminase [Trebonia sp.]
MDPAYVSTGHLPARQDVRDAVDAAYRTYRGVTTGTVSDVYPALSRVEPGSFGICLAGTGGSLHEAGDARQRFTIMSVAKPFVFALACPAASGSACSQARHPASHASPLRSGPFTATAPVARRNPFARRPPPRAYS